MAAKGSVPTILESSVKHDSEMEGKRYNTVKMFVKIMTSKVEERERERERPSLSDHGCHNGLGRLVPAAS